MAVPVKFTPDMSDVKRAIAEVRSDAARGATFDISAGRSGFASGGNSVPPANSILSGPNSRPCGAIGRSCRRRREYQR
jgi:hypothetical protein